jgi:hypothetical protein
MTDETPAPEVPMMAEIPEIHEITSASLSLRISPAGLRALEKASGRTMTELLADDADFPVRFQVFAFAELYREARRAGRRSEDIDPGEMWEEAADVEIDFMGQPGPHNPLDAGSSTTSPPSAATGG